MSRPARASRYEVYRRSGAKGAAGIATRHSTAKWAPPVGGWNARDALPMHGPTDAVDLLNVVPRENCRLREGFSEWATGVAGDYVETLMVYAPSGTTEEMFAAGATFVYDVSAAGPATAVISGLSGGRWSWLQFGTPGGEFLMAANGADGVYRYSSGSWTVCAITGVAATSIATIAAHVQRIWMIPLSGTKVWYLPVQSVAGTATSIELGAYMTLGGDVVAMASWTRDGGSGMDDMAAFITSRGQVIIYSGSDPSSVSTWQQVGVFRIAQPLGRNCVVKTGADVGIITEQGVMPMSSMLPLALAGQAKIAATDKIRASLIDVIATAGGSFGWQIIESPRDQLMLLNVPVRERVETHQYVMSVTNGSWCRWEGINAGCWALFNGQLHFGGFDGAVYAYGGDTDNGAAISGQIVHAFTDFGTPTQKNFKLVRPLLFGPVGYEPVVTLLVDYDTNVTTYAAPTYTGTGPEWDEIFWDVESWGADSAASAQWQTLAGSGITAALVVTISSQAPVTYNGALVTYETGGIL